MAPSDLQLKEIFSAYDADGSGKISVEELTAALAKAGKKMSKQEVANIVRQVDKNNDGEIDFEEFKAVHQLAPENLPAGVKELAGLTSGFFGGLGNVSKAVLVEPSLKVFDFLTPGKDPSKSGMGSKASTPPPKAPNKTPMKAPWKAPTETLTELRGRLDKLQAASRAHAAAASIQNVGLRRSFNTWVAKAQDSANEACTLQDVLGKMRNVAILRAFNTWQD